MASFNCANWLDGCSWENSKQKQEDERLAKAKEVEFTAACLLERLRSEHEFERAIQTGAQRQPGVPKLRTLLMDTKQFEHDLNKTVAQLPGALLDKQGNVVFFDTSKEAASHWTPDQIRGVRQLTEALEERANVFYGYTKQLDSGSGYTKYLDSMIKITTLMDNYVSTYLDKLLKPDNHVNTKP